MWASSFTQNQMMQTQMMQELLRTLTQDGVSGRDAQQEAGQALRGHGGQSTRTFSEPATTPVAAEPSQAEILACTRSRDRRRRFNYKWLPKDTEAIVKVGIALQAAAWVAKGCCSCCLESLLELPCLQLPLCGQADGLLFVHAEGCA